MQQGELYHAPPSDGGDGLTFPTTKVEVVSLDVAVAPFNLLEQPALGMLPVAKNFVGTDIVGKDGEEQ